MLRRNPLRASNVLSVLCLIPFKSHDTFLTNWIPDLQYLFVILDCQSNSTDQEISTSFTGIDSTHPQVEPMSKLAVFLVL